jgi:hypothetical protein
MEVLRTTGDRGLDEEINRILARVQGLEGGTAKAPSVAPSGPTTVIPAAPSLALTPFDNGNSGSGTVSLNFLTSNNQVLTLTGNPTLAFDGLTAGYTYTIELIQDATGTRTVTWPGSGLAWQGGSAPTLTVTASKTDLLGFYYDGATMVGYVIAQGF